MEEHLSQLTVWVNHLVGRTIPEYLVMSVVVLILGTVLALFLRSRLSVERPGGMQQVAEMLLTNPLGFGIKDLLEENVGHGGDKFIAFTGSISIFILLANLLGVIPAFSSPTGGSLPVVPLGCALLTFLYFNWQGLRHHGVGGYLLTFAGSPKKIADWLLAVLLFPVELLSTSARLLSLTVRLWANIFASDLLYAIFLSLLVKLTLFGWEKFPVLGVVLGVLPMLIPLAFIGLHIFVSVIQAYVFTVLPAIYLGMATADEH